MDKVSLTLQVFFKEPFWVGVFERREDGKLSASRVVFGAEPKDYEVYDFVLRSYYKLRFGSAVETAVKEGKKNPKRMLREVRKQMEKSCGIGTKAQQALKLQQEELKIEHMKQSRQQRDTEKQHQFELKQQKKKEKHRGR